MTSADSGDLRIEPAGPDDLPAMADLLHELFTLESDFQPDRPRQLAALKLILDQPEQGRLFALRVRGEGGHRVAGMVNALLTISTAEGGRVLLLEDVIVAARHRRHGYGRRLVEHALAWGVEQGCTRVTLLVDLANQPAKVFYARLGFDTSNMGVMRRRLP